ncbi:hypothetical protein ENBRE01_1818 [Enteropsectra breve]|nr:hypothetical protein ENBRE01_1818 [Enteropsectra breve]
MEGCMLLLLVCKAFSILTANRQQRILAREFQVKMTTSDKAGTFDMRDIYKTVELKKLYLELSAQNRLSYSPFERLLMMSESHEEALTEIACSIEDTFESHAELMKSKLQQSTVYKDFLKDGETDRILDIVIPLEYEIVCDIFKMTSEWCTELRIKLDTVKIQKILPAFKYLGLDTKKEVDLFLKKDKKPLHLRINIISLFCINFVYLMKINNLLVIYQTIDEKPQNNALRNVIDWLCDIILPLRYYIKLLQIQMEDNSVSSISVGSGIRQFVYEMHHDVNSKVILLLNKEEIERLNAVRVNILEELNTIGDTFTNRRLTIFLPLGEQSYFQHAPLFEGIPKDFHEALTTYLCFMQVLGKITEVYIHSAMPYFNALPTKGDLNRFMERVLDEIVDTAIRTSPGLSSLLIDGFNKFPEPLFELLRKTKLNSFGVQGCCSKVDFIVMYRILKDECALKKSIRCFLGQSRALKFISNFLPDKQITSAKVSNLIREPGLDLYDDEKKYEEQIKQYFAGGSLNGEVILSKKIELGTLEYLEPVFMIEPNNPESKYQPVHRCKHRPQDASMEGHPYLEKIPPQEIFRALTFSRVLMSYADNGAQYINSMGGLELGYNSIIKTLEVIMNEKTANINFNTFIRYLKRFMCNDSCLILKYDINDILSKNEYKQYCIASSIGQDIAAIMHWIIPKSSNELSIEVIARKNINFNFDPEKLRKMLIEYCIKRYKEENYTFKMFKKFSVKTVSYRNKTRDALKTVHL